MEMNSEVVKTLLLDTIRKQKTVKREFDEHRMVRLGYPVNINKDHMSTLVSKLIRSLCSELGI